MGIPTVADRIAQEVARRYPEPILEPVFHADSYGYRPGKSAIDAVRTARRRCWRHDFVLDIDVKGFFDSLDWEGRDRAKINGRPSNVDLICHEAQFIDNERATAAFGYLSKGRKHRSDR